MREKEREREFTSRAFVRPPVWLVYESNRIELACVRIESNWLVSESNPFTPIEVAPWERDDGYITKTSLTFHCKEGDLVDPNPQQLKAFFISTQRYVEIRIPFGRSRFERFSIVQTVFGIPF